MIGPLVALFVSLILYSKHIARQHAPVIAAATGLIDDRIGRNVSSQADLQARVIQSPA